MGVGLVTLGPVNGPREERKNAAHVEKVVVVLFWCASSKGRGDGVVRVYKYMPGSKSDEPGEKYLSRNTRIAAQHLSLKFFVCFIMET